MGTSAVGRSGAHAELRRYDGERLSIRLFVLARHLLAPLDPIADLVDPLGPVLDVGCGHGLFTNMLALRAPERLVIGVEPSSVKLAVARRSSSGLSNVRYLDGYIDQVEPQGFRTITILDVLYLLPDVEKLDLLRSCRRLLAPDGTLLLKTNDTRPGWKFAVTRLQEEAMTRLGLTLRRGMGLHFRGAAQYVALLREAGFYCHMIDLTNWLPYPHRLFIATTAAHFGVNGALP